MNIVKYLLAQSNSLNDFTHDKQCADDSDVCGKYRPDILYNCKTHYVIVEVDENQHSIYDPDCEMVRMQNIMYGLGLPTVFIRYNPDTYKINGKIQKITQEKRLKKLVKKIKHNMNKIPKEMLKVKYLFYNKDE